MKTRISPLSGLVALTIAGLIIFFACSKDPVNTEPSPADPAKSERQGQHFEGDRIIVEGDDIVVDDPVTIQYCPYTVDSIGASDDPGNWIKVGDVLCYNCPNSGNCPAWSGHKRTVTISYRSGDYTTEVYLSGGGAPCTTCPQGGKVVQTHP